MDELSDPAQTFLLGFLSLYGFATVAAAGWFSVEATVGRGNTHDLGIAALLVLAVIVVSPLWPFILLFRFFGHHGGTCFGFGFGGQRPWKRNKNRGKKKSEDEENIQGQGGIEGGNGNGQVKTETKAKAETPSSSPQPPPPPPYNVMELPVYPARPHMTLL